MKYTEPELSDPNVTTDRVLAKPFTDTWNSLVRNLTKSFFVINSIDKTARFIELSFSLEDPAGYVDCGRAKRTYSHTHESRTYQYDVAGSADYKVTGTWGRGYPYIASLSRRASLEGRASIFVDPKGTNKTVLTTNVRYVWTIRVYATEEFVNNVGIVTRTTTNREIDKGTIAFSTNQVGSDKFDKHYKEAAIKCRSTGGIEATILGMADN